MASPPSSAGAGRERTDGPSGAWYLYPHHSTKSKKNAIFVTLIQQVIANGLSLDQITPHRGRSPVYPYRCSPTRTRWLPSSLLVAKHYYALLKLGLDIWTASLAALVGAGVSARSWRPAYRPIRERTPVQLYMLIASHVGQAS